MLMQCSGLRFVALPGLHLGKAAPYPGWSFTVIFLFFWANAE
jgi:hypothetical protein